MPNLVNVLGIENTSEAFRKKVLEIADRLLIDPNFLMAIMSFESLRFNSHRRTRQTYFEPSSENDYLFQRPAAYQ